MEVGASVSPPARQPLKIAHLLPWPSVGGVEAATVRLARAVEGDEFTSVAFCLQHAHAVRSLFESAGVPVTGYEAVEPSVRHPSAYLRASVALARQLRASGAAIVHCSDLLSAHRCSLAALLAGLPLISHVRGRVPEISFRDRTFLRPVRRFVFVSREARESFGYRVSDRRAMVLYDGVDTDAPPDDAGAVRTAVRTELGIPATAPVVGMVARVAAAKDYPTLIRAAVDVVRRHPDATFLIVGQHSGVPEYREHFAFVQRTLEAHGLSSRFVFTDHRRDVDRMLAAMDVCVLSTHGEGLPLAVLEAMARGKPVVATAVGGIPEMIRHGETGCLVPHEDHAALARELLLLLDDPAYATRIGTAARAHVAAHFSRAAFAEHARALYRQLARAHTRE